MTHQRWFWWSCCLRPETGTQGSHKYLAPGAEETFKWLGLGFVVNCINLYIEIDKQTNI